MGRAARDGQRRQPREMAAIGTPIPQAVDFVLVLAEAVSAIVQCCLVQVGSVLPVYLFDLMDKFYLL
jgi:L-lactate permease